MCFLYFVLFIFESNEGLLQDKFVLIYFKVVVTYLVDIKFNYVSWSLKFLQILASFMVLLLIDFSNDFDVAYFSRSCFQLNKRIFDDNHLTNF